MFSFVSLQITAVTGVRIEREKHVMRVTVCILREIARVWHDNNAFSDEATFYVNTEVNLPNTPDSEVSKIEHE
jgi:hypothetical protein